MQTSHRSDREDGRHCARRGGTALFVVVAATVTPDPARAAEWHVGWIGDFAAVLDGGLARDERHLGLVELAYDHSLAFGDREIGVHASAQHIYGGGFSEEAVGDLQAVSNIDADDGTRVLEAWIDVPLSRAWSLKLGRYDLNSEFDVIEPAGLFLHSSQGIGADIAQTGAAGPSIFPQTAFGVRLQYAAGDRHTVRGVALDVESDPDADHGDTPFIGGTLLALEYGVGTERTLWTAGAWTFTRSRASVRDVEAREREYGAYGSVQHRIDADWATYLRVGVANEDASRLQTYVGAGIVHAGGLLADREDEVGFAIAHARNGGTYRDVMQVAGVATTAAETAVELTWRVPLREHVVLQPDLQYVIDPDPDPGIDDAFVAMLRVEVAFGF
jgi:porin